MARIVAIKAEQPIGLYARDNEQDRQETRDAQGALLAALWERKLVSSFTVVLAKEIEVSLVDVGFFCFPGAIQSAQSGAKSC